MTFRRFRDVIGHVWNIDSLEAIELPEVLRFISINFSSNFSQIMDWTAYREWMFCNNFVVTISFLSRQIWLSHTSSLTQKIIKLYFFFS